MILTFFEMGDTDIVCIVGSGIPSGRYLRSGEPDNSHVLGHKIVRNMDVDRSGSCHLFVRILQVLPGVSRVILKRYGSTEVGICVIASD